MMYISPTPEDGIRLKGWSAATKGAASTLRIEIEIDDPLKLGFFLRDLQSLQKAQQAAAKPRGKKKPLMLPSPDGFV